MASCSRYFAVASLVLLTSACRAEVTPYEWSEEVRRGFIEQLRESRDSVVASESFSKRIDEPEYLADDLVDELFDGSTSVVHRQLRLSRDEAEPALSLGILVVEYASESTARKVAGALRAREPKGTFKTGKVLIRFSSARRGRQVLVAYSESFLSPEVERIFRSVSESGSS